MVRTKSVFVFAIMAAQLSMSAAGGAQDKSTYYTVQHPSEFAIDWKGFYDKGDQWTAETRKLLPHQLNLAYGADPKQRLDVYAPASRPTAAPVFIFLHGGGFREGDRAHYGFVARPLAKHGVITVVASYRMLPKFHYPDQLEDTRQIVAWVYRNIASHGGDPERIYIGGHSAGAMLTAQAGVNTGWLSKLALPDSIIKGGAPISGSYDLAKRTSDYVPDVALRAEANPLGNITRPLPHWVIAVGLAEASNPPILPEDSLMFGTKLREKGASADVLVLDGLNHSQTALALGDETSPLTQALLKMIQAKPGS